MQYTQRESTWMALQLAEHCRRFGDVSVLAAGPMRPLGHAWDSRVIADNKMRFTDWARPMDALLWFYPGAAAQVRWAAKDRPVSAMLVPDTWNVRRPPPVARLNTYSTVYCNAVDLPQVRRDAPKASFCSVHWDPQLPIVRRTYEEGDPVVVLPLLHGAAQYAPAALWRSVDQLLQQHSTVRIRVLTDLSSQYTRWQLRKLQKRHGDRIVRVQTSVRSAVLPELQTATLTWLPLVHVAVGLVGLWSISVGTPVMAFDITPYNTFVKNDHHGWLVLKEDVAAGFTGPGPMYSRMVNQLLAVLARPARIRDVYGKVSDAIQNRRTVFDCVWRTAFGH